MPGQMNSKVVEFVCSLYEADPKITLAQICLRLQGEMSVTVAQSTAHKYLRGMVFTRSRLPPPDYTSMEAKEETRKYISAISNYMQQGKEIIWLGEHLIEMEVDDFCKKIRATTLVRYTTWTFRITYQLFINLAYKKRIKH